MQAVDVHHPVSMQLFQILVHLDIQQPHPGQGNPADVFWKMYQAFQAANADPAYDMVAWAQSYYTHQRTHPLEQHPPAVVLLSNQILQWTHQWPHVQNEAQALEPAQAAFNQQVPPVQHQAYAVQLGQPPFNQQAHPVQEQGPAMQSVQPMFNQQGYVVQQEGQAVQLAQPAVNQHGPLVQQQDHLMQPAQHALYQQGTVLAQDQVLGMQLAQPALHQPRGAADHGGAANHDGAADHYGAVNDAVHYAAADNAAQAGVNDGAANYGAAFADADGYDAPYGVAGHDAGYGATSSASHGALQDPGDNAAAGMLHDSSADVMVEDDELQHLHYSDRDMDMDFLMGSLDSSQLAELESQATGTDGEDTRIALLPLVPPPSCSSCNRRKVQCCRCGPAAPSNTWSQSCPQPARFICTQ